MRWQIGDQFPDIELPIIGGNNHTLKISDLRGQKVLIFMWASW